MSTLIVAVTGWRKHTMRDFIIGELGRLREDNEVHVRVGDATGVDAHVRNWCIANGYSFSVYQADWNAYGLQAGPMRNREMLLGGVLGWHRRADLLMAFPEPDQLPRVPGSGSWGCVGEAFKLGIMVMIPPVPRQLREV